MGWGELAVVSSEPSPTYATRPNLNLTNHAQANWMRWD